MKKNSPYSASLTGCGFCYAEFTRLIPWLMQGDAKQQMKDEVRENRYLMMNSESTRKRAASELLKRYEALPADFWNYYLSLEEKDQKIALLYALLKAYPILEYIHREVVMPQYRSIQQSLTGDDIVMCLYNLGCQDAFVDSWTEQTKNKIASWYQTVLSQAGILNRDNQQLQSVQLSDASWFISNGKGRFLEYCLLRQDQIASMF